MNIEQMSREELIDELIALRNRAQDKALEHERSVHSLKVHEVELQTQNQELRETQNLLEQARVRFQELYDFAPIAYFTFDRKGIVLEANLTAATLVGGERARFIGKPFIVLVKFAQIQAFWGHLERSAKQGGPVVSEMRFLTQRGGSRDFQVISSPVFDASGDVTAFRTSFTDITERKAAEAELERATHDERRLRQRYEALDHASLELGHALARLGASPLGHFLQAIVDQARSIAGSDLAAIGLGDDAEHALAPLVFSGLTPDVAAALEREARPGTRLADFARLVRLARSSGGPTVAESTADPEFVPEPPSTSFLGVPVRYAGRTVAALYFAIKRSETEFTRDDQRVIEMFAERAGVALETARLAQEVRAAVIARDNLLAVVSHDLRSPLSAIQLSANLLSRDAPLPDRRRNRKQVDVILRSTKRMNRLIEDLLQAANIEAGLFTVEPSGEEVASLVDEVVQLLDPMASARQTHVDTDVTRPLPRAWCDRGRLLQVLANLVGNAIKFTSDGGKVRIRVWPQAGEIRFSISDDGPGIAQDHLDRLFDRYWRAKPEGRHGVGLGLFIAKGIVDAHGGRIWVESQVGVGTTFTFTMPVAPQVEQHAPSP